MPSSNVARKAFASCSTNPFVPISFWTLCKTPILKILPVLRRATRKWRGHYESGMYDLSRRGASHDRDDTRSYPCNCPAVRSNRGPSGNLVGQPESLVWPSLFQAALEQASTTAHVAGPGRAAHLFLAV